MKLYHNKMVPVIFPSFYCIVPIFFVNLQSQISLEQENEEKNKDKSEI